MLRSWFDRKQQSTVAQSLPGLNGPRVPRHSGAWSLLRKRLQVEPGLCIIDTGYTSPANINFLTGLGHSLFLADLEVDAFGETGSPVPTKKETRSGTSKAT